MPIGDKNDNRTRMGPRTNTFTKPTDDVCRDSWLKSSNTFYSTRCIFAIESCNRSRQPDNILRAQMVAWSEGNVQTKFSHEDVTTQNILCQGNDITIVAVSYMNQEALKANNLMKNKWGISSEIISFRNYSPEYLSEIIKSVKKTKKMIFVDTCSENFSIGPKIFYDIRKVLKSEAELELLALEHIPEPTSYYLTKNYYNYSADIVKSVGGLLGINDINEAEIHEELGIAESEHHDVPARWFKGPF